MIGLLDLTSGELRMLVQVAERGVVHNQAIVHFPSFETRSEWAYLPWNEEDSAVDISDPEVAAIRGLFAHGLLNPILTEYQQYLRPSQDAVPLLRWLSEPGWVPAAGA